ncbi:MAG: DNA-binding protein [Thermoplasmata archaeon]|nr:DNA-binding protein [Thermoplasmata archaeon]
MSSDDEDLEVIRKKRLAQLQSQQAQAEQQEAMKEQADQQKQAVMRQILTPEARDRLARIKIAKPEFVEEIEQQLIMLAQSGQLSGQVTDQMLVQILERIMPEKREINIKRI